MDLWTQKDALLEDLVSGPLSQDLADVVPLALVPSPTNSIYLNCDDTASHYLRLLMDAIFGRQNYQREIIWKRTSAPAVSVW